MASQVGAPSVPAPAQSTPFARRTMGDPVVFYTEKQSPPPKPLTRLFVPIISIDHLSQDFEDLPVDNILALGDQALLGKFRDFRIKQLQSAHRLQMEHHRSDKISQFERYQKSQLDKLQCVQRREWDQLQRHQINEWDQLRRSQTHQLQQLRRVPIYQWLQFQRDRMIQRHELDGDYMRKLHTTQRDQMFRQLSHDAEQFYYRLHCQLCQLKSNQGLQMNHFVRDQSNGLLSESIDQAEVLGPLVENLYIMLDSLKRRQSCEMLLYLSGHGMDPGNLCLIPDAIKPHPARDDLRHKDPAQCYTDKCQQDYLRTFYEAFRRIKAYKGPLGFVGGELYAHQRGYVGVLGVLGLWCYAHKCSRDGLFHHLVIVADCCFAGIWGATLERIMNCTEPCLKEYRKLLLRYPVSIQCATDKFEASHGGSFTPLWFFLQTASEMQLKGYERKYEQYKLSHGEPVSRDFETQHPWFISTSAHAPSCKCFDNADFFVYLHGAQREELQDNLRDSRNKEAYEIACASETKMTFPKIVEKLQGYSPLAHPYVTALAGAALNLRENLQMKKRQVDNADHPSLRSDSQHQRLLDRLKKSIPIIEQSLDDLRKLQLVPLPRFRRGGYVLDSENRLNEASRKQLMKILQPHRRHTIDSGVYVFQGGEGDMSLIVTPDQEQVILIDGTKTADCFKKAWESTLRYLSQITHIFVTHHDLDHTKGIQLLLARYCVGQADMLPDISCATIYMNTRAALRRRSFGHEEEICTLATTPPLDLQVRSVIVGDRPGSPDLGGVHCEDFFIEAILPKQSLVDEVMCNVLGALDGDNTKAVSSRGGTTAANVLSINLVAVWKKRVAYLFTGDAHLKDVTQAADDFLRRHGMTSFKYVDVPHHGSAKSNVVDVDKKHHGLAGIPADNYLISHRGNHQNPSLRTVTHILKRDTCEKLHFLYPSRRQSVSCRSCQECDNDIETRDWHCECVRRFQHKIETLPLDGRFKFFKFD